MQKLGWSYLYAQKIQSRLSLIPFLKVTSGDERFEINFGESI